MSKILGGATLWARQTIESDVFYWKPDKWFKIWFFIINKVNHKDTKLFKRGTNFTTYKEIQRATKATHGQVDKFIRWAKQSIMIETEKTTRGMIITVLNYDIYQCLNSYMVDTKSDRVVETQSKHSRNTVDTINKNDKNDKNKIEYPEWLDLKLWNEYKKHRKEIKRNMTLRAEEMTIKKLKKLIDAGDAQDKIIEQSIERGWIGLFYVKKGEGDLKPTTYAQAQDAERRMMARSVLEDMKDAEKNNSSGVKEISDILSTG